MEPKPTQRLAWIDVAKGVGILLVVMGHIADFALSPADRNFVWVVVFVFHMPLFFILSGYLFKLRPMREVLLSRAKSLLLPYAVYLVLIFGFLQLRDLALGTQNLRGMLFAGAKAAYGGRLLVAHFGVFWFVPCLFLTQVAYNLLVGRMRSGRQLGIAVALSGVLGLLLGQALPGMKAPLAVNLVPVVLVFYAFGHFLRETALSTRQLGFLAAVIVIVSGGLYYAGVPFELSMKSAVFAPPLLILPLAAALAWIAIKFCQWLSSLPLAASVLGELGRASLVIMFVHQFIHFELRGLGVDNQAVLFMACLIAPYAVYQAAARHPLSRKLLLGQAKA